MKTNANTTCQVFSLSTNNPRKPNPQQSEKFRGHLKKVTGIMENAEGESSESDVERVKWDDALEEDHVEVLGTEVYARKVVDFVLEHHAKNSVMQ